MIPSPTSSPTDAPRDPAYEVLDPAVLRGRRVFHCCKRSLDVVLALVMIVGLLPLWLVLALLIKLDSRGPLLFVNRAVGQHSRTFFLYKFRSMHPLPRSDKERSDIAENLLQRRPTTYTGGRPVYKTAWADGTRITRVGRWLRRTSLDELPQLWNILRGDLSFVGPRPSLPDEVALYNEGQKQRLLVPQGLTGLYQVTARNRVPIEEMIRIDLLYIRQSSFWFDLRILFKTPAAMLSGL